MINFIYPSIAFNKKEVDPCYEQERSLAQQKGYETYLVDLENIKPLKISNDNICIYRGWMLDKSQYELLYNCTNNKLINNCDQYLFAHHIPNWYPILDKHTMNSIFIEPSESVVIDKKYFVKDWVKSLKTKSGSVVENNAQLTQLIEDMKKFRGHIEGSLVLRQWLDLDSTSEVRFFMLNGSVFSKDTFVSEEYMKLAFEVGYKISEYSNFACFDIISDKNNNSWLVEIGDGQVSDAIGWCLEDFYAVLDGAKKNEMKTKLSLL